MINTPIDEPKFAVPMLPLSSITTAEEMYPRLVVNLSAY
jgi:hypothetical protein